MGVRDARCEFGVLVEPIPRKFPDRLEHREPQSRRVGTPTWRIRLFSMRLVSPSSTSGVRAIAGRGQGRNGLDSLKVGVGEDRKHLEQTLLLGLQELITPVHGGAQRLLPLRQIARPGAEDRRACPRAGAATLPVTGAASGRGELDRQRQAVEPAADLRNGRRILVGQREVGPHRLRAVEEELDGFEGLQPPRRKPARAAAGGSANGGMG